MIRKIVIFIITISTFILAIGSTDITNIGVGARPLGMGKSFVGLADDASSIFLNPAGLGKLDTPYLQNTQTNMLGDVDYFTMGGVAPLLNGANLGASFLRASVGGIPITEIGSDGRPVVAEDIVYSDTLLMVAYGDSLNQVFKDMFNMSLPGNLYGGFSFKYFSKGVPKISMGRGADFDLGILYDSGKKFQVGLLQKNLLTLLTEESMIVWDTGARDMLDSYTKLGVSYQLNKSWLVLSDYEFSFLRGEPLLHLGTEYDIQNIFQMRAGWEQIEDSSGGTTQSHFSMGFSFDLGGAVLDYAYVPYYELDSDTTHYVSLQYKFSEITIPSMRLLDEKDELAREEIFEEEAVSKNPMGGAL